MDARSNDVLKLQRSMCFFESKQQEEEKSINEKFNNYKKYLLFVIFVYLVDKIARNSQIRPYRF